MIGEAAAIDEIEEQQEEDAQLLLREQEEEQQEEPMLNFSRALIILGFNMDDDRLQLASSLRERANDIIADVGPDFKSNLTRSAREVLDNSISSGAFGKGELVWAFLGLGWGWWPMRLIEEEPENAAEGCVVLKSVSREDFSDCTLSCLRPLVSHWQEITSSVLKGGAQRSITKTSEWFERDVETCANEYLRGVGLGQVPRKPRERFVNYCERVCDILVNVETQFRSLAMPMRVSKPSMIMSVAAKHGQHRKRKRSKSKRVDGEEGAVDKFQPEEGNKQQQQQQYPSQCMAIREVFDMVGDTVVEYRMATPLVVQGMSAKDSGYLSPSSESSGNDDGHVTDFGYSDADMSDALPLGSSSEPESDEDMPDIYAFMDRMDADKLPATTVDEKDAPPLDDSSQIESDGDSPEIYTSVEQLVADERRAETQASNQSNSDEGEVSGEDNFSYIISDSDSAPNPPEGEESCAPCLSETGDMRTLMSGESTLDSAQACTSSGDFISSLSTPATHRDVGQLIRELDTHKLLVGGSYEETEANNEARSSQEQAAVGSPTQEPSVGSAPSASMPTTSTVARDHSDDGKGANNGEAADEVTEDSEVEFLLVVNGSARLAMARNSDGAVVDLVSDSDEEGQGNHLVQTIAGEEGGNVPIRDHTSESRPPSEDARSPVSPDQQDKEAGGLVASPVSVSQTRSWKIKRAMKSERDSSVKVKLDNGKPQGREIKTRLRSHVMASQRAEDSAACRKPRRKSSSRSITSTKCRRLSTRTQVAQAEGKGPRTAKRHQNAQSDKTRQIKQKKYGLRSRHDVEEMNEQGQIVLKSRVKSLDVSRLFVAVREGDVDTVTSIFNEEGSAASMWRNENRETVLHVVAKAGHVVAARTILAAMEETQAKDNRQLDVNSLRDKFGLTPVHVACNWGRADVLRLLMEYCGDVNFRDNIGQSALFWTTDKNSSDALACAEVLFEASEAGTKERGTSKKVRGRGRKVRSKAAHYVDMHLLCYKGLSTLYWAVALDRPLITRLLLSKGAWYRSEVEFKILETDMSLGIEPKGVAVGNHRTSQGMVELPKFGYTVRGIRKSAAAAAAGAAPKRSTRTRCQESSPGPKSCLCNIHLQSNFAGRGGASRLDRNGIEISIAKNIECAGLCTSRVKILKAKVKHSQAAQVQMMAQYSEHGRSWYVTAQQMIKNGQLVCCLTGEMLESSDLAEAKRALPDHLNHCLIEVEFRGRQVGIATRYISNVGRLFRHTQSVGEDCTSNLALLLVDIGEDFPYFAFMARHKITEGTELTWDPTEGVRLVN